MIGWIPEHENMLIRKFKIDQTKQVNEHETMQKPITLKAPMKAVIVFY